MSGPSRPRSGLWRLDAIAPNSFAVVEQRHVTVGHQHRTEPRVHPDDGIREAIDAAAADGGHLRVDVEEVTEHLAVVRGMSTGIGPSVLI